MSVVRLEDWSVVYNNPYAAPETCGRLRGIMYGHAYIQNGEVATTSRIKSANGRLVTTRSGNVYELGEVNGEYAEWHQKECGKEIDPNNPVIVKEGVSDA